MILTIFITTLGIYTGSAGGFGGGFVEELFRLKDLT